MRAATNVGTIGLEGVLLAPLWWCADNNKQDHTLTRDTQDRSMRAEWGRSTHNAEVALIRERLPHKGQQKRFVGPPRLDKICGSLNASPRVLKIQQCHFTHLGTPNDSWLAAHTHAQRRGLLPLCCRDAQPLQHQHTNCQLLTRGCWRAPNTGPEAGPNAAAFRPHTGTQVNQSICEVSRPAKANAARPHAERPRWCCGRPNSLPLLLMLTKVMCKHKKASRNGMAVSIAAAGIMPPPGGDGACTALVAEHTVA
jgi:hypothetical protein